jgi:ABC-type branched-subunit amino acid transport system substrate-binding protein/tRNA A-37 threonylcarbamoyl transferase component Bud32
LLEGEGPGGHEAGTTDLTVVRETVPLPGKKAAPAFEFLSPPQAPDELGRMAHYRVLKVLGRGGMGIVFQAEDLFLRRRVALKVMSPALAQVTVDRQRFLREARAVASVRNDHVVTVHEVSQHDDLPYLAMELLEGERLDLWLHHVPRPALYQVVRIGMEIAEGLQAAHERGMIHRDIKPANIWLEAPYGRVKVLDFGLARHAEDVHLTQAGTILGTPAYMAPEQAEPDPVDHRCDLFSLGCVLYQLATGQVPFAGNTAMSVLKAVALKDPPPPRDLDPSLPPELADLIVQLLAKRPADRPASARVVAERLRALLDGLTPTPFSLAGDGSGGASAAATPRPYRPTPPPRPPRGRRRLALVLAGLALLLVGTVAVLWWLRPAPEPESIPFGMSAAFEGPARELGRSMEVGVRTYFQHVNSEGGVRGRKLELIALDDGYEPDRALRNMKKLHEENKVLGVIGNVGTPTAKEAMPYAVENRMLFFAPFTGAQFLRKSPPRRYVFNYRAGYEDETAAIVTYLLTKRKLRPEEIAVFAQQDAYGDAGFSGVARRLRGVVDEKDILRVGHERNSSDVSAAVKTILEPRDAKVQAVVMVSVYRPAAEFIVRVKNQRPEMIFTNVSFVDSAALAEELRERDRSGKYVKGVIITQVVPPPDSPEPGVVEYRERLERFYPQVKTTFGSLEGYVAARILVEGLRRTEGAITTESLIDKLETINGLDLGIGTTVTFGPHQHDAQNKVWGTELDALGRHRLLELE